MLAHASGSVLEVAAGTGRNLEFYSPEKVDEIILVDNSSGMLEEAKKKLAAMKRKPANVDLRVTDATALPFASDSFDTVIDTYGLCSVDDVPKVNQSLPPSSSCTPLLFHSHLFISVLNMLLSNSAFNHCSFLQN